MKNILRVAMAFAVLSCLGPPRASAAIDGRSLVVQLEQEPTPDEIKRFGLEPLHVGYSLFRLSLPHFADLHSSSLRFRAGCVVTGANPPEPTYLPIGVRTDGPQDRHELWFGAFHFDPRTKVPILSSDLCLLDKDPRGRQIEYGAVISFYRGTLDAPVRATLLGLGIPLDLYISENQFIVPSPDLTQLNKLPDIPAIVEWVQPLQPGLKLGDQVSLGTPLVGVTVQRLVALEEQRREEASLPQSFFEEPSQAREGPEADGRANQPVSVEQIRRLVDETERVRLAQAIGLVSVENAPRVTLRNSTTSWVIQTGLRNERRLFRKGLLGDGQVIGIIDNGLDVRHCFFSAFRDEKVRERKIKSYLGEEPPRESEADLHGTYVAGIAAGQDLNDPEGRDRGQAPRAQIVFTPLDAVLRKRSMRKLFSALEEQHKEGARVITNSWGDDSTRLYTILAWDVDTFLEKQEDDLVIVGVSDRSGQPKKGRAQVERPLVMTPENARNALAVGASIQGLAPDKQGMLPPRSDKGPTIDGRRKPEILAPGCRIRSAVARTACDVEIALGDDHAICGTSWAAPAVAGGAALVREYFEDGWFPKGHWTWDNRCTPTGALVKAMLLNGTVNVREEKDKDDYPSDEEGWGRLLLDASLYLNCDTRKTVTVDVRNHDGLHQNEERWIKVSAPDLKVTLVWTDPAPVIPGVSPILNDLDLKVYDETEKKWYCGGDDFDDEHHTKPDCKKRDPLNNVEQVVLSFTKPHDFTIFVKAANITAGVGGPLYPAQGYALVVSGQGLVLKSSSATVCGNCSNATPQLSPGAHSIHH